MRCFGIFSALLLLSTSVGCVSLTPPEVEVTGLRPVATSQQGGRFEISLAVSNPSSTPLPLPEASYRLRIDGVGEYAYIDLPAMVVGAKQTQNLRLPAAIAGRAADLADRPWSVRGSLVYEPDRPIRKFLTETGAPLPRVLFDGEGKVSR